MLCQESWNKYAVSLEGPPKLVLDRPPHHWGGVLLLLLASVNTVESVSGASGSGTHLTLPETASFQGRNLDLQVPRPPAEGHETIKRPSNYPLLESCSPLSGGRVVGGR